MKTAYFVKLPSRIEDLRVPHPLVQEKPYSIFAEVELKPIDYENFITDLCVDRWFIEENMHLCSVDNNGVRHCVFVHRRNRRDGVLVMSDGCDYPKWAAYLSEK